MPNEWVSKKRCSAVAVLGWRLLSQKLPTQTRQFLQRDGAYKLPNLRRQIAPWKPAQRTVSQRVSGICFLHGSISSPQNAPWLSLMSDTEPIGSKSLRDAGANAPFKTMFRDLKLGGYNLEVTQLTTHRLISIILLVTIADSISTLSGRCIRQKGVAKYVCCPTEANRFDRRHSSFSLGLHGQNWIESNTFCQDTVQELSGFSTDKNDYYRQAMRAKTLIQRAF